MAKPKQKWARVERELGRLFLFLLFLGAIATVLELYARWVELPRSHAIMDNVNDVTHMPRPYVMSAGKPLVDGQNALGYRGPLPAATKTKDEYRIFIFGSSVVYNGNPPFSFLLEGFFHKKGLSNVHVFNFGAVSSISRQDLVRLFLEASTFQPDMVVFYGGYGDISPSFDERPNYPHRYILYEMNPAMKLTAAETPFWPMLALNSQFLRNHFQENLVQDLFEQKSKDLRATYKNSGSELEAELERKRRLAYAQNLRLAALVSASLDAKFQAILQPTVYFKEPKLGSELSIMQDSANVEIAVHRIKDLLVHVSQFRNEFSFTDFSGIYKGVNKEVFRDPMHISQEGIEIVAKKLFGLLLPQVQAHLKERAKKEPGGIHLAPETDLLLEQKETSVLLEKL